MPIRNLALPVSKVGKQESEDDQPADYADDSVGGGGRAELGHAAWHGDEDPATQEQN
jgi:hypothetical protein